MLFTVRLNVAAAVAPLVSVTLIVYADAALAALGVPATKPLAVLRVNPTGRPGETP